MPNCFTLTKRGAEEPAKFIDIDNAMCEFFAVTPDEDQYYKMWYDIEGLGLAMGKDWDYMREKMPERKPIIDWLEANYLPNAWSERKF